MIAQDNEIPLQPEAVSVIARIFFPVLVWLLLSPILFFLTDLVFTNNVCCTFVSFIFIWKLFRFHILSILVVLFCYFSQNRSISGIPDIFLLKTDKKIQWKKIVFITCISAGIAMWLMSCVNHIAAYFHVYVKNQTSVDLMMNSGTPIMVLIALSAIIIAPVTEELLFRHIIFYGIYYPMRFMKQARYAAIAISSVFFALYHFNLAAFLPLTFMGFVFQIIYLHNRSLLASMTAHALFNFIQVCFMMAAKYFLQCEEHIL